MLNTALGSSLPVLIAEIIHQITGKENQRVSQRVTHFSGYIIEIESFMDPNRTETNTDIQVVCYTTLLNLISGSNCTCCCGFAGVAQTEAEAE